MNMVRVIQWDIDYDTTLIARWIPTGIVAPPNNPNEGSGPLSPLAIGLITGGSVLFVAGGAIALWLVLTKNSRRINKIRKAYFANQNVNKRLSTKPSHLYLLPKPHNRTTTITHNYLPNSLSDRVDSQSPLPPPPIPRTGEYPSTKNRKGIPPFDDRI